MRRLDPETGTMGSPARLVNTSRSDSKAQDLALEVLDATIRSHKLRILRSQQRSFSAYSAAQRSIEQLKVIRAEVLSPFRYAKAKGQQFRVSGAESLGIHSEVANR